MNLLCPNCGKMLTVPEQYAGQMMKCPLCSGTFTVPALPGGGSLEPPPASQSASPASSPPDPYQIRHEGSAEPVPAFQSQKPAEPAFDMHAPEPAFQTAPPLPPSPSVPPLPAAGPTQRRGTDAAGQPELSQGFRSGFTIRISEKVLRWVVPACLLLIFVLTFFSWVGVYPGGVPAVTQSAWGAAFGGYTEDLDMKSVRTLQPVSEEKDLRLGLSFLLLFYLLFFLVTFLLSIAVVALQFVKIELPPQVKQLLPWQWAGLAGLNAVLLLFLGLQMLLGFSLENYVKDWIETRAESKKEPKDTKEKKMLEVQRGSLLAMLQRTNWLRLAFFLQLVATVAAGLVFWIEKRGPNAPSPEIDVKW